LLVSFQPLMAEIARLIEAMLAATPAAALIERARASAQEPGSVAFRALFASVSRRLGSAAGDRVTPPPELTERARPHFTLVDWTRARLLLLALEAVPAGEQPGVVLRLYEGGELGEQESVLRVLSLLPEPARFVATGVQGCRTNAKTVFEAIACDNPFPAAHFPELNFNQLVMKALFMEAPVARIEGLAARRGPELLRMANDYASERRAAGRPVPADVALISEGTA
jgi:hypothetical protein